MREERNEGLHPYLIVDPTSIMIRPQDKLSLVALIQDWINERWELEGGWNRAIEVQRSSDPDPQRVEAVVEGRRAALARQDFTFAWNIAALVLGEEAPKVMKGLPHPNYWKW